MKTILLSLLLLVAIISPAFPTPTLSKINSLEALTRAGVKIEITDTSYHQVDPPKEEISRKVKVSWKPHRIDREGQEMGVLNLVMVIHSFTVSNTDSGKIYEKISSV